MSTGFGRGISTPPSVMDPWWDSPACACGQHGCGSEAARVFPSVHFPATGGRRQTCVQKQLSLQLVAVLEAATGSGREVTVLGCSPSRLRVVIRCGAAQDTTRKRAIDGMGTNGAPVRWCATTIY